MKWNGIRIVSRPNEWDTRELQSHSGDSETYQVIAAGVVCAGIGSEACLCFGLSFNRDSFLRNLNNHTEDMPLGSGKSIPGWTHVASDRGGSWSRLDGGLFRSRL